MQHDGAGAGGATFVDVVAVDIGLGQLGGDALQLAGLIVESADQHALRKVVVSSAQLAASTVTVQGARCSEELERLTGR